MRKLLGEILTELTTFERYRAELDRTTITEKIDYKTLLIHALRTVETSILSGENYIIESSITTLHNLIPTSWRDDQFNKEIKESKCVKKTDIRPIVAGRTRMSEETCKELGIPTFEEKENIDHFKTLHACINLLERLGVLMRRTPKAWIPGKSGVSPNDTRIR